MSTAEPVERASVLRRWPVAAGLVMAVFAGWGVATGAEVAGVVTASGFVYLGAAALRNPKAAWPVFAVSFVAVGLGSRVEGLNETWIMLALAAALAVYGVVRGAVRPPWGLPLQAAALLVLAAAALLAAEVNQTVGGLLVAGGLLAHTAWDIYHYRANRVVVRSMSEFCGYLDTILALVVLYVTFT